MAAKKEKKKFDWHNFLLSGEKEAIHCETPEEIAQCIELMRKHGIIFFQSTSNYWNAYKNEVCFTNMRTYGSVYTCNKCGFPIYRFSAYDFED